MIRFRKALPLIGATAALTLLAGCAGQTDAGGSGDDQAFQPVELTVSSIFPTGSTSTMLLQDWMDAVTEGSDGAITFDYYGDGTLHPSSESLSALSSDLTDITFVSNGAFPDQLPISNWDDLVVQTLLSDYGYPNMNVAGLGQQVPHYSDDNVALPEMAAAGFKPLLPMLSGPAALTCAKPFETADDLAGRQVRVPNAIAQAENEALGMTGVFTPPNEQYEALQRGVIDCAVNAPTTVLSASLLEVSPYVTFTNNAPSSGSNWVISTSAWDSLDENAKELMLNARHDAFTNFAKNTLDQYADMVAATEEAGGEIIDAAALNPVIAEYWAGRPDLAETAPDGVDAETAIAQSQRVADAWFALSEELDVPADSEHIIDVLTKGSSIIEWDAWTQAMKDQLGAE